MNRYSQITTSEFNPLSFQEIMAAPLAMRQKHDNAIAAAEALRIKADPLDKHLSRALEIKNQMDAEIAKNVDILNKEGYNPTTFQNITKLNRQYQDMISPTGEIGQINNAKVVYDTNKEEFIKDAAKQNIGREQALKRWNEKTAYYTGFGEDGKSITNVSPQGVAAYQDYTKDKQVAHSILGKTVRGVSSQGHHLEVDKQTGGVWEITRNGKRVKSDNTRQVEAALKSALDKWDNLNGEGKKWLMDSGDGLNRDRIINDFNSMLERSDINDISETANYNAPTTGGDGSGTPGTGVIINNDSTLKSDALNYTNYSDALNARKRLMKSNSPKDRAELADLEDLQRNADSKLKTNPKYKEAQQSVISKQKDFDNFVKDYHSGKIKMTPSQFAGKRGVLEDNIRVAKTNVQNIKDRAWKESSSSRHSYSYLPTNSNEQTNWDIYNRGIFNTLKGGNLANLLDVSSIHTTNGSKTNVSNTDVNNIQTLLNGADEKSFTINSIKTYGSNKTPEVTMTFIPNKNAKEYTMDRRLFTDYNDYGGAEKPVTVTFRLKDFSNASKTGSAVGYKSLSGAIADFWKDKGGVNKITNNYQGAEVKDAFVKSEYSKYSNDELNKLRNIDEDANRALQIRYMEYQASKQ